MRDTNSYGNAVTEALEKELEHGGIVRRYPSSGLRKESLKKIVLETCDPADLPYVDAIVSILSDSAKRAVETIWSEKAVGELSVKHRKTQSRFPDFMRLDFGEVASNLTVNWLETREARTENSKTRKQDLDVFAYKYRKNQTFIGWLKTLWQTECRNIARKKNRQRAKEFPSNMASDSGSEAESQELVSEIMHAAGLTIRERLVLRRRVILGQSYVDIARICECSATTIRNYHDKAIEKCKRVLKSIEFDI